MLRMSNSSGERKKFLQGPEIDLCLAQKKNTSEIHDSFSLDGHQHKLLHHMFASHKT